MYIQPLQAVESPGCYHVGGDVTIHPSATIAPGALIRADPNCRVEIGSAACVGMGVVIHACDGAIEIASGVSLGAAVLIVGRAEIGANASIGSSSTLRNCTVESGAIVPAASLLGELESTCSGASQSPSTQTAELTNGTSLLGSDIHSIPEWRNDVSSHEVSIDASTAAEESKSTTNSNTDSFSSEQPPALASDDSVSAVASTSGRNSVTENGQVNGNSQANHQIDFPTISPADSPSSTETGEPVLNGSTNGHVQNLASAHSRPLISGPPVDGRSTDNDLDVPEDIDIANSGRPIGPEDSSSSNNGHDSAASTSEPLATQQSLLAPKPITPKPSPAFGKSQVSRLMKSLFPHSKAYAEEPSTSDATEGVTTEGVTSEPTL